MAERNPVELLPLRPRVFAILLALSGGPRHGYGIMQMLQEDPAERWLLGPATLYRTLKEMQQDGLIVSTPGPEEESGGPPRRYYALSQFGRRVGAAEAARMASLSAKWKLGLGTGD